MTGDRDRWVAIEQDFCDHPKLLEVGAPGVYAHLRAILYAAKYRTNGFIPARAAWQILHSDAWMDEAAGDGLEASMIEANLWHREANGYQIHDYLRHQPTAEALAAKRAELREKRAEAGRRGGLASASKRASTRKQTGQHPQAKVKPEVEGEVLRTSPSLLESRSKSGGSHKQTDKTILACLCGQIFKTERALALHDQNVHGGPSVPLSPDEAHA